jgi:hypothetical protein
VEYTLNMQIVVETPTYLAIAEKLFGDKERGKS